jgi:hypothetical protein
MWLTDIHGNLVSLHCTSHLVTQHIAIHALLFRHFRRHTYSVQHNVHVLCGHPRHRLWRHNLAHSISASAITTFERALSCSFHHDRDRTDRSGTQTRETMVSVTDRVRNYLAEDSRAGVAREFISQVSSDGAWRTISSDFKANYPCRLQSITSLPACRRRSKVTISHHNSS